MQERACCHVTLAGKLRVECKTTKICVKINDICTELILTRQSIITNMLSLPNAKQHTQRFQAYSHQTSTSTFPRLTMQLRRVCWVVWDQPTLIMTGLNYSSVAGGVAVEEEGSEPAKRMAWDKTCMKREVKKKKKGNLRRGWALQDKQNALKWERWR